MYDVSLGGNILNYAGDEFYFLHVISEIQPDSSLLAGMIGVNSALMIGHHDEEQHQQRVSLSQIC